MEAGIILVLLACTPYLYAMYFVVARPHTRAGRACPQFRKVLYPGAKIRRQWDGYCHDVWTWEDNNPGVSRTGTACRVPYNPKNIPKCEECGKNVSATVKDFCRRNPRFGGRIYCISHQRTMRPPR